MRSLAQRRYCEGFAGAGCVVDTVIRPPPEQPNGLPHEVGARIRAAQDELARTVQIANLTNDPLRHVLEGLATHLGAQHRLSVETVLTLSQTLREARLLSPEAEKEFINRSARHIAGAIRPELLGLARDLKFIAWVGLVAVAIALVGAGYLFGTWHSEVARLLAT
jgi:hypothetical protein